MIAISFPAGELLFAVVWLLCRALVWLKKRRIEAKREAMLLLMYVNLAVLLRFVCYPFHPDHGHILPLLVDLKGLQPPRVNLRPLVHLSDYAVKKEALINNLGNIALFLPSGLILPLVYRRLDRWWKVILAGAALSLSVELLQLLLPQNVSDVDDVLLNTLGTAIGCGIWELVRLCRRHEGTPDSMMYGVIFLLVRLWLGKKQRVEIDDKLLREVEPPYILLANHESFEDFYYISQMAHPRRPSYLVNEFYTTRPILKTMAKKGGILSKKLFTRDLATGVGLLRTIRKGYPVVIFPEGRLSPDGRSNPIVESGAALYRKMKTTLVLTRIEGAYWAHPKWREKTYRSKIRLTVRRVLRPAELAALTNEQLDALIREELYNDASAYTGATFPQKDRAVGLEGLLYRCADCGALYRTVGVGDELRCRACGRSHRLDERYHFTDMPGTIPAWYDAIRRMETEELDALSLRAKVKTKIFGENGGPVRWETGECSLDTETFRYRSDGESFEIPASELPALAFSCGEEFELYHNNELHYFYPLEEPQQVARWALAVDLMAEQRRDAAREKGESRDGSE